MPKKKKKVHEEKLRKIAAEELDEEFLLSERKVKPRNIPRPKKSNNKRDTNNEFLKLNDDIDFNQNNLEKHKVKKSKTSKILKLILLIIILFALLIFTPLFKVKNIYIKNNMNVSEDEIIKMVNFEKDKNIFILNKNKLLEKLKMNSKIKDAKIIKKLPCTLEINIIERIPKFSYEITDTNNFAIIDENGYIIEISQNTPNNVISLTGLTTNSKNLSKGMELNDDDIKSIKGIIKILSYSEKFYLDESNTTSIFSQIDKILVENKNKYTLYINSQNKIIHFGESNNFNDKFTYIVAIMKETEDEKGEIFVNMNLMEKNPRILILENQYKIDNKVYEHPFKNSNIIYKENKI